MICRNCKYWGLKDEDGARECFHPKVQNKGGSLYLVASSKCHIEAMEEAEALRRVQDQHYDE